MMSHLKGTLFIPADIPNQPYNPSDTEEVVAIVARNDPNEQESVELYDPAQEVRQIAHKKIRKPKGTGESHEPQKRTR
jgi:hypothetical protein